MKNKENLNDELEKIIRFRKRTTKFKKAQIDLEEENSKRKSSSLFIFI